VSIVNKFQQQLEQHRENHSLAESEINSLAEDSVRLLHELRERAATSEKECRARLATFIVELRTGETIMRDRLHETAVVAAAVVPVVCFVTSPPPSAVVVERLQAAAKAGEAQLVAVRAHAVAECRATFERQLTTRASAQIVLTRAAGVESAPEIVNSEAARLRGTFPNYVTHIQWQLRHTDRQSKG
jgi:hypothetical protein